MYYDIQELLTKNRILSFVIGSRGGGKTYNAKRWAIRDFISKGNQFVWVRRYESELKEIATWTLDITHEFPDNEIVVKGKHLFIDGKKAGKFIALSTSQREKSKPFPYTTKVIFDEFLIDKGSLRYIKNEVELFLELLETITRTRDNVRAVFIANAISVVNPYFTYFDIRPNTSSRFTMNEHVAIEMYFNEEFKEVKNKTRLGKLISKTNYGAYAIDNHFLRDCDTFIDKRENINGYMMTIKYNGVSYGAWYKQVGKEEHLYIDKVVDVSCKTILAFTLDDLDENSKYKKHERIKHFIFILKTYFDKASIQYSCQETKKAFFEIIKLL